MDLKVLTLGSYEVLKDVNSPTLTVSARSLRFTFAMFGEEYTFELSLEEVERLEVSKQTGDCLRCLLTHGVSRCAGVNRCQVYC